MGARVQLRGVVRRAEFQLSAIVWLFGYVLVEIAAIAQGRSTKGEMFLANTPLLVTGIGLSMALAWLLDRLRAAPVYQRVALVAVAGLVAGIIQTVADDLWLRAVALTVMPDWRAWAVPYQPAKLFTILVLYLWTFYLTIALMWAARTTDHARMNEARAAAFEAAVFRAEATALRLQLNPHFLFNTLNGIASLVVRNRQDEAEEMIGRLADFMRASFASNPTGLVTLGQELEMIVSYLDIEKVRFGDQLRIDIDVAPGLMESEVPNFILQPLVENVIKHAGRGTASLTIAITARQGVGEVILSVINYSPQAGATEAAKAPSGGISLGGIGHENTRQRLANHYGANAWFECRHLAHGFRVEIGIPGPTHQEAAA